MAHKRKDQLTTSTERGKHLRPLQKKQAAKRERKAAKEVVKRE